MAKHGEQQRDAAAADRRRDQRRPRRCRRCVPNSAPEKAPISSCPSIATLTTPVRSHEHARERAEDQRQGEHERCPAESTQRHDVAARARRHLPAQEATARRRPAPTPSSQRRTERAGPAASSAAPAARGDEPEAAIAPTVPVISSAAPPVVSAEGEPGRRWSVASAPNSTAASSAERRAGRRRSCGPGSRTVGDRGDGDLGGSGSVVMPSPALRQARRHRGRAAARSRKIAFTSAGAATKMHDQRLEHGDQVDRDAGVATASGCRRPAARRTAARPARRPTA